MTLLAQDHHGGLKVRRGDDWIDVPTDPYVLVVHIGDLLELMTRGGCRSNPHRVRDLPADAPDRGHAPLLRWTRRARLGTASTATYLAAKVAKV